MSSFEQVVSATDREKHQINIVLTQDELRAAGKCWRWDWGRLGISESAPAIVLSAAHRLLPDGNIGLEDAFR